MLTTVTAFAATDALGVTLAAPRCIRSILPVLLAAMLTAALCSRTRSQAALVVALAVDVASLSRTRWAALVADAAMLVDALTSRTLVAADVLLELDATIDAARRTRTTADAVEFVTHAGPNVGATITAHHLMFNRNHMLVGGIRPHFYCLPILKRNIHQDALVKAATSGSPKFFLGTDSAPHAQGRKESACGCAGSYTAHAAIELYAEVFEAADALDKLEAFSSFNGPDFYNLPRNTDTITLKKESWNVPETMAFGGDEVVPIRAGEAMLWKVI